MGSLVFQDSYVSVEVAPVEAIADLFSKFKRQIHCVILNACYSPSQATEISKYIDCVDGISNDIDDHVAILFHHFYNVGFGRSMRCI